MEHLYLLQSGQSEHGLTPKYLRKYQIRVKLANLILNKTGYIVLVSIVTFVPLIYSYLAYVQIDSEFSLLSILIICTLTTIWSAIICNDCVILLTIIYISLAYIHLRLQPFVENSKQLLSVFGIISIKRIMSEHNQLTELTEKYNSFFKYMMASLYLLSTPGNNVNFYLAFYGHNIFIQIAFGSFGFTIFLMLYMCTYTPSKIAYQVKIFKYYKFDNLLKHFLL